MAYCNNCKQDKPGDQKFCDVCGAQLAESPPAQAAAPQPPPAAPRPPPGQPAQPYGPQPQYGPQMQQALGFFNKLGIGLQIAGVGAVVSFVFSLIVAIQISSAPFGGFFGLAAGFMGAIWFNVIAAAAAAVLIYFAQMNTGKTRIMMIAGVIALGSIWLPGLISGWGYGLMIPAMLGGIAEVVGGFVALSETA